MVVGIHGQRVEGKVIAEGEGKTILAEVMYKYVTFVQMK